MKPVRFLFVFACAGSLAILPWPAFAQSQSILCSATRPGENTLELRAPLDTEGGGVKSQDPHPMGLELDASLASSSFLFLFQDKVKQQRLVFSGSPRGLSPEGISLATSHAGLSCRKEITAGVILPSRPRIVLPDYLVCVLDEVLYKDGAIASSRREILSKNSAFPLRLRQLIQAESQKYGFSVSYFPHDPFSGLQVSLLDKATGEQVRVLGPGQAFLTSFLLGFTQGDRARDGKFLRLGCAYTHDPSLFEEEEN